MIRLFHKGAGLTMIALTLAGCAELKVYPLAVADTALMTGAIPYNLPMTVIDLAVSVTLNSCETKQDEKGAPYLAAEMKGMFSPATAVEADPTAAYYLSYNDSRRFLKEINYTVGTYPNGSLQTFNATINDQAGPIAVATISTVIQIASAGAIPRIGDVGGGAARPAVAPEEFCSQDVVAAFKSIKAQKAIVTAEKARADAAQLAALGDPAHPGAPTPNAAQTAEVIAETTTAITAAQAKISNIQKSTKLTRTATYHWAPTAADGDSASSIFKKSVDLSPVIGEWLSDSGKAWIKLPHLTKAGAPVVASTVTMAIAASADTVGSDIFPHNPPAPLADRPGVAIEGFVIRTAARGQLKVYQGAAPADFAGLVETTDIATPVVSVALPQFGRRLELPVHNTLFQTDVLSVAVNADGTIGSIGFHASSTAATGIAGAGTAAGAYGAGVTARNTGVAAENTANAAKATYSDTVNKALADCYSSAATILKANGTPVPCQP